MDSFQDKVAVVTGGASGIGAALVRQSMLLVVSDPDKVDVHGKVLNQVAKIFLEPPPPMGL